MTDYWGGYESGMVKVDRPTHEQEAWILLPHRCDEWVIGSADQAQALIADLEAAIRTWAVNKSIDSPG